MPGLALRLLEQGYSLLGLSGTDLSHSTANLRAYAFIGLIYFSTNLLLQTMRLLKRDDRGTLSLTDDLPDQEIPEYVILSHTWGAARQEVSLQDFQSGSAHQQTNKTGYAKIWFCSDQAAQHGYRYFWIDTCCIDKTNSVELTEAINSMFRWYRNAARCYVYLSDVNFATWHDDFAKSRWFTRGWTLQELLAPRSVEFFSADGICLGNKIMLEEEISSITGIAIEALRGRSLSDFSVSERMKWASKRTTTRKEDGAYSLLGIFDVYMPLIYGERERALVRLREYIDRSIQGKDAALLFRSWVLGSLCTYRLSVLAKAVTQVLVTGFTRMSIPWVLRCRRFIRSKETTARFMSPFCIGKWMRYWTW